MTNSNKMTYAQKLDHIEKLFNNMQRYIKSNCNYNIPDTDPESLIIFIIQRLKNKNEEDLKKMARDVVDIDMFGKPVQEKVMRYLNAMIELV